MASVGLRGAASLTAIDGDNPGGSGMLDTKTPAGWHSIYWWGSVIIIAFLLWAL
jgi:hypothetical protein